MHCFTFCRRDYWHTAVIKTVAFCTEFDFATLYLIPARTEINGESMSMVGPTLGSRTAKEHRPLSVLKRDAKLHCEECCLTPVFRPWMHTCKKCRQIREHLFRNTTAAITTRSSAIAEGPRDASCQLKSCQLPRNSVETTYTTSPDQIDGMKLEI